MEYSLYININFLKFEDKHIPLSMNISPYTNNIVFCFKTITIFQKKIWLKYKIHHGI